MYLLLAFIAHLMDAIKIVSLVPLGWGVLDYSKNTVTRWAKTSTCYLLFKWARTASAIICSSCTFTPNYSTDCYMISAVACCTNCKTIQL